MISILYPNVQAVPLEEPRESESFHDLGLDALEVALVKGRARYRLHEYFRRSLGDIETIRFRQDVMRDMEREAVSSAFRTFSERFNAVRLALERIGKMANALQKDRLFLDAVADYCGGVLELAERLARAGCASAGMARLTAYLNGYAASEAFVAMHDDARRIRMALERIRYCVQTGHYIVVRNAAGQPDLTREVEATFAIFRPFGPQHKYEFTFSDFVEVNHIEASILALVAANNPREFRDAAEFRAGHEEFLDAGIANVEREAQFCLAYGDLVAGVPGEDTPFCYPVMTASPDGSRCLQTFDLALARKLKAEGGTPVCNDFLLQGGERMLVVTGPNQGGKTTYARTVGQIHHLASLGMPVPGREARLCVFDRIFTHFEREENLDTLHGKLQDDLVRVHAILKAATPGSLVIINEIFASTTFRDALTLSGRIAATLLNLDVRCVWVTFIEELAELGEKAVSMVSTVEPDNPAQRTYRIVRRRPDGLAYAVSIAEKYGLTYTRIKERLGHGRAPALS
ncbi:MutS domain V [Humidesulfovibrio mexicanus]|uniref:MutS domain V n=1 Tax=Humidesulfovibrio mexicanus TaxID=147047 RepID=A0A239CJ17_9BACT|nr:hypothetical protein [Humidesulfovibrio mexicanus]SNS19343.1 MutS domain V [Humidesulfovibrio mexicanus]